MAKIAQSKKNETAPKTAPLTEKQTREVERLAYQFFLDRGGEHGHDREDWDRAVAIVRSKKAS